jgi:hypothetical protein
MGIVNRRNAVIGWAVVKLGKRAAKKKARDAVPGTVDDSKRPNKPAIAVALAGLGGALMCWRKLMFWRKRRGGEEGEPG